MQAEREHNSDLMIELVFSILFFVEHQNLFPKNSCIFPIKTLQINCYIFRIFFVARWAVPYQGISEVRTPQSSRGAFLGAPRYCCIRLRIRGKKFERKFRQKVVEKAL